ncbi:MAG: hypothetical protein ABIR57_11515 [Aeromicrobium sp.]
MAKHRIAFQQSTQDVLHSDMTFVVHRDREKLGEPKISKGTIDWKPRNKQRAINGTGTSSSR